MKLVKTFAVDPPAWVGSDGSGGEFVLKQWLDTGKLVLYWREAAAARDSDGGFSVRLRPVRRVAVESLERAEAVAEQIADAALCTDDPWVLKRRGIDRKYALPGTALEAYPDYAAPGKWRVRIWPGRRWKQAWLTVGSFAEAQRIARQVGWAMNEGARPLKCCVEREETGSCGHRAPGAKAAVGAPLAAPVAAEHGAALGNSDASESVLLCDSDTGEDDCDDYISRGTDTARNDGTEVAGQSESGEGVHEAER